MKVRSDESKKDPKKIEEYLRFLFFLKSHTECKVLYIINQKRTMTR